MSCEYKLTNLVFKNQENSAKHNFLPLKKIKKKKKTQKPKNNGYKGKAMKHKDHENKTVQGHKITPIT